MYFIRKTLKVFEAFRVSHEEMLKTGQVLMNRCQAESKGDYGTDHKGRDDNHRILVFVHFHADFPVILLLVLPIFEHFFRAGHEHIN